MSSPGRLEGKETVPLASNEVLAAPSMPFMPLITELMAEAAWLNSALMLNATPCMIAPQRYMHTYAMLGYRRPEQRCGSD